MRQPNILDPIGRHAVAIRTLSVQYLTGELTPSQYCKALNDMAWKVQQAAKIPRVRMLDTACWVPAPMPDQTRTISQLVSDYCNAKRLTVPSGHWWWLKDQTPGEISGVENIRGVPRFTNGVLVAIERGDGEVQFGHIENFKKDKPQAVAVRRKSEKLAEVFV